MNTWKRPLLPKGKLSRPERLVKELGHHTMQPNAIPDMQCTMLVKKPTRRSSRILTPSLQKSTTLLTSLERENADVVGDKPVKNDAGEMSVSKDSKQKAWLEHYQTLSLTETQTTCLINHRWKAHPSQSLLIWLRRLSHR